MLQKVVPTASLIPKQLERLLPPLLGKSIKTDKRRKGPDSGRIDLGRISRAEPISEQLSEDVIRYLGPTLQQHKGCTIIDFDPGTCQFSSKLHDYLQPKKHYLIESDSRYYEPFIRPLVNTDGSKYVHAPVDGFGRMHTALRWQHSIRTKLDPDLLPERKPLPADDPRKMQFDPSILVIGNLGRTQHDKLVKSHSNFFDVSRLVLFSLAKDLLVRKGLFEAGLVRMLWWVSDSAKVHLIASNTPNNREPTDMLLDMAFHVSQVAGVEPMKPHNTTQINKARDRLDFFSELASKDVADRMSNAGLVLPPGRSVQRTERRKDEIPESLAHVKSPFADLCTEAASLSTRIDEVSSRIADIARWAGRQVKNTATHKGLKTLEYPQCNIPAILVDSPEEIFDQYKCANPNCKSAPGSRALKIMIKGICRNCYGSLAHQAQKKGISIKEQQAASGLNLTPSKTRKNRKDQRSAVLLDLGLRLLHLEASYKEVADRLGRTPDTENLRERVLKAGDEFRDILDNTGRNAKQIVQNLIDDHLGFFSKYPLMNWDRRAYEPLQAAETDFFPPSSIALLDFMPKPIDLTVPDLANSAEATAVCADFLSTLFTASKSPLPERLEAMAVNASKDLIPMVPAITDPRRGGRLNPRDVKARMLTTEMIEGLTKAWFEWPFRPQGYELSLVSSSMVDEGAKAASILEAA